MITKEFILTATVFLLFSLPTKAQEKISLYKNPKISVDERVKDLISKMTLEEKVGQLSTLLGWEMYDKKGDTVSVSDKFKQAVSEKHIGNLWAALRADPWTKKTLLNGLDPYKAAQVTNAMQKYVLEHSRLQIPIFIAEECPHGHMAIGTTVFPTAIGQGSTWNPELINEMAGVIAREARLQGAHIGYGPVLDLAREPRWSRVEETYGEDPFLNGQMGAAMVKGFQGSSLKSGLNVISTLKHFAAYGAPEGGHNGGVINTGNRELFQNYFPPFKTAVNAGALSVMMAYNSVDGIPCSSSSFLMNDVLRKRWGFNGFTVSDLGSIDALVSAHHVAVDLADAATLAINAGLDNDLGGAAYADPLLSRIRKSEVDRIRLDEAVGRILRLKFEMGLFEQPYVDAEKAKKEVRNLAAVQISLKIAQESIVMLKNENSLLPLKKNIKSVAVIGPNADNIYNQLGDYTAPQDPKNIVTVLEGLKNKLPTTQINYVKGCDIRDTSNTQIAVAVQAAKAADAVIVVLGGSSARDFKTEYLSTGAATVLQNTKLLSDMESGEGYDRETLDLTGKQLDLLKSLVATGKPVVLVLIEGRPLNLNWPAAHVPAIINAWYPGEQGGNAIADVLFGDYNPAGRLPISIPRSVGQLPVYYNYKRPFKHDYVEGPAGPLYEFGYGLSYSKFTYSNLSVDVKKSDIPMVEVKFNVTNTGNLNGDEVVQLYLQDEIASVAMPIKQLKAFKRINLKAGESRAIRFILGKEELMLYNQMLEEVIETGDFKLLIGASSNDVKLKGSFTIF